MKLQQKNESLTACIPGNIQTRSECCECFMAKTSNIVRMEPEVGTLAIRDDYGFILVYGHLEAISPGIKPGIRVQRGQDVGRLGVIVDAGMLTFAKS